MYGPFQKARHVLRGGAALVLALLLCAAMPARAAGVTAGGADQDTSARMLVPVGHTVGIKLFARGVMVVKAPESGTPADDCGLQTGDIIVKCGGPAGRWPSPHSPGAGIGTALRRLRRRRRI